MSTNTSLENGSPEKGHLPYSGPLARPLSLDEAAQTLRNERITSPRIDRCVFNCDEFTSVCPRTGQPDFGRVFIMVQPNEFGLESKALKFYLWAFRDEGMFCETIAERIADDVFAAIEAKYVYVTVDQFKRGGIALNVTATRGEEPPKPLEYPELGLT